MNSKFFEKANIGSLLGVYLISFVLTIVVFLFLVGIEICLLATLRAISISFFVVTVGVVALLALLVPYGIILIYGGVATLDLFEEKVPKAKVVISVLLILLFLAIWTYLARKCINISYGWLIELEKKDLIAFPDSFRIIPIIG